MKFSALQIAQLLEGEVVGDENRSVSGLSKIEEGKEGTLSFLANPAYTPYIYSTGASIVIVADSFIAEQAIPETCTLIKVKEPYASFSKLLELYNQRKGQLKGVSLQAFVDTSAEIGEDAYVAPGVFIGPNARIGKGAVLHAGVFVGDGAKIGDHSLIHAGVKILDECEVGAHCILQPGAVLGGDGFGFAPNAENDYKKVPQIGNVILEDYVEVGANTTIDRATFGSTIIRKGVKLDNLVQIAHNVEIGENTVIAAQTGIAGSTKIGKNCMIGGQVGIIGHLKIADGVKIAAQSGIGASIPEENSIWQGSPAFEFVSYKKSYIGFRKLPEIMRELHALKQELAALNQNT